MISVDISNVWCSVSLPELLAEESTVTRAHSLLTGSEQRTNPWLSWLECSDAARRSWIGPIAAAAERIRNSSRLLVVVGGGLPSAGAQAAVRLRPSISGGVKLLFVGDHYSPDHWLRVVSTLESTDFSVLAVPPTHGETAALVTLRSLRWIMDKRYGAEAASRIYIAAQSGALARLGEAMGYQLLPVPEAQGGRVSALSPAALLIMAAAGMSPGLIYSGAAEMAAQSRDSSLDNPVLLYAAARSALKKAGLHRELLCTPGASSEAFGSWWLRAMAAAGNKDGCGIFLSHARLPGDFFTMGDALLEPGHFASLLQLPPSTKKVSVEVDWKDADGLSGLAGQEFSFLEQKNHAAIAGAFSSHNVPFLILQCDEEMTDDKIGELLCFTEMAAGLSALTLGAAPAARRGAGAALDALDRELGRK